MQNNEINTTDMFSDRDKEIGYDEAESVFIRLSDEGIVCGADAVEVSGSTVTVTEEGTYILSGTLTDGMVVVKAEDTDKVFLTTAFGTENMPANGGTYAGIDENKIDAAVFSKSDLTLNGEGKQTVTAEAEHAVAGKDSVRIAGGGISVNASDDGIDSNGNIVVSGGIFAASGSSGMGMQTEMREKPETGGKPEMDKKAERGERPQMDGAPER